MNDPIPMVLHCPHCGAQHVDAPKPEQGWANPPHRSHLCDVCGFVWRPADVATTGVAAVATRGTRDMPLPLQLSLPTGARLSVTLRDARGVVIERATYPAAEAVCAATRFMLLHGTDPDGEGEGASAGEIFFCPEAPEEQSDGQKAEAQ